MLVQPPSMNPNRWLKLGMFGWVANAITLLWCLFTSVMWLFPLEPNPKAEDMSE